MVGRTYYTILGVPNTESTGRIRSAYRDLARKLHPDVAGEQATSAFQELNEAYDVLSDPRRRRAYNDELRRAEVRDVASVQPVPSEPRDRASVSIFGPVDSIRPRFEATYERFRRDFTGIGVPKSEHLEELNIEVVEVVLTSEEERRGCALPIGVPVFRRCPECGGSGRIWHFPCLACEQQGTIEDEEVISFRIPPLTPSGSIFEMPLQGLGIHNFCLRLHVFVEP